MSLAHRLVSFFGNKEADGVHVSPEMGKREEAETPFPFPFPFYLRETHKQENTFLAMHTHGDCLLLQFIQLNDRSDRNPVNLHSVISLSFSKHSQGKKDHIEPLPLPRCFLLVLPFRVLSA